MTQYINVSDRIGKQHSLEICTNTASSVSILQWQCQGAFIADTQRGVVLECDSHIKKARSFINVAKETGAGLVMTPEYSFPYEVLEGVINQQEYWPEKGKLWCFGTQGDSYSSFKERIERWSKLDNVRVEELAFDGLRSIKSFVSPLIYLLKTNDDELYIIPQFKTGPMHDPWNDFEGAGLCEGNTVFVLDLVGETNSRNRFISLICSDVLYIKPHEIIRNVGEEMCITLFHPQLNEKPRHTEFINFRRNFMNSSNSDNKRLITLNWAQSTTEEITSMRFDTPWSSFYSKTRYEIKQLEGNHSFRKLRMKNHMKGLFYTYKQDDRIDIWFSNPEEHCKLIQISKSDVGNIAPIAAHREDPIAVCGYSYDCAQEKWIVQQCICKRDIDGVIGPVDTEYSYPLNVCNNDINTCNIRQCVMDKCDFFFGSCFGHFEEGQITCDNNEIISRLTINGDIEINKKRKQNVELFKTLVELLKVGEFPDELIEFKNNHKFEIDEEVFPVMHKEKHNLSAIDTQNHDMKAIVAITETRDLLEVENLVSDLKKHLHSKYRDQIMVFYPSGTGFKCYSEHLKNTKITKGRFSKETESIT